MTKKIALTIAMSLISADGNYPNPNCTSESYSGEEVRETLAKMIEQLDKRTSLSDEKKQAINEARKAKTAAARAELVATVIPILTAVITGDMTAREIYEAAKDNLPDDFSEKKVQNILIREMASSLIKTEAKGKANTYRLA